MSNVLLCQGAYSKIPYYISDDCRNIYSIEELCYYLYHYAYLLDDRFVTVSLGEWISDSLELVELGKEVTRLSGKKDALSKLVELLAAKIGYYEKDAWKMLLEDIGANNRLTIEERRKSRADGFLQNGKYMLAMDEYETVLRETRITQTDIRAKIYHNMGVCAACMFMFELAADYFRMAYDNKASVDSYISMLAAMKLYMKPTEYLTYLSEHKESYEDSLELERKCELLKLEWSRQPAYKFIGELRDLKEQGPAYYDGINSMSEEIKEEYRESCTRG